MRAPARSKRTDLLKLIGQLELIRDQYVSHWQDIADHILPRSSEFQWTDRNNRNDGSKKYNEILDNTATTAERTFESGMMAALTSPAQPWFRLSVVDQTLAQDQTVKLWLDETTERMRVMFRASNLYNRLPPFYGDLVTFGTAAMFVEKDDERTITCSNIPIGSYMIANGPDGRVNTFVREMVLSVRQLVEKFGQDMPGGEIDWSKFSERVKSAWARGDFEHEVPIYHVIQPNRDWQPNSLDAKYKRFTSTYFERSWRGATPTEDGGLLRESGYDIFPVIVARWRVTGTDYYGTSCPGMDALGDIKQLQTTEKVALQMLEKAGDPPLTGPSSMRDVAISTRPGHFTPEDVLEGRKGMRPIYEVRPDLQPIEFKQQQVRERIKMTFFEPIISALLRMEKGQMTAREIEEIHSEKFMLFGPVLEQINFDALTPLIDLGFAYGLMDGIFTDPPQELSGAKLDVEYVSIMAVAQKLSGVDGLERLTQYVTALATGTGDPGVWDVIDTDEAARNYGTYTSVAASIVRPKDAVAQIRAGRVQQAQMAQMMQGIQAGAGAAKDLASAKTNEQNALTDLVGQVGSNSMVPV